MSQNTQSPQVPLNGHAQMPVLPVVQKTVSAPDLRLRLDAQAKAPKSAERGAGNLNDAVPRLRDDAGLPKTRPLAYLSPGLLAGRPLAETNIGKLLEKIAVKFPGRAEKLATLYEEGLRFNKQMLDDFDRLAREEVEVDNAEKERRNTALEAWQAALETERDQKCTDDRAAVVALDKPLAQAHGEAAQAVARAGSDYDPAHLTSEVVLRERPLPLEVVTGREALPWTPGDDDKRLPEWLQMTLKVGVGMAVGLSIGFITHMLSPDNLSAKAGELVGSLFLGYVVAAGGGAALSGLSRRATERYWLARFGGYGPIFWIPSLLLTVFTGFLLVGAEATVETLGLLAPAKLEEQNGGTAALPWMIFGLVGLMFSVGYLVTQTSEGSLDGRFDVILNRAKALQHEEFAPREQAERQDEEVQIALEKLGLVRELTRQVAYLEERIDQTIQPFNTKIEALESLKTMPQNGLSERVHQLIRDFYDNWCGPNSDWHEALDTLLDEIEPLHAKRSAPSAARERGGAAKPGWWDRIKSLWGRRGR